MKLFPLLLAIAFMGSGCEKKPSSATESTDAAKLRPEVAAAQGKPSPTPLLSSPTPSL